MQKESAFVNRVGEISGLDLNISLYTILQILSVSLFEKTPLLQAFSDDEYENEQGHCCNQLMLFD